MNFFKMTTLAVVAGAGLALAVAVPSFADGGSASTSTTSSLSAGSNTSLEGAASTRQNTFNASEGTATATGSTDPLTTSGGTNTTAGNVSVNASLNTTSTTNNTDGTTTNAQTGNNIAPTPGNIAGTFGGFPGQIGVLDGGGTTSNNDNTSDSTTGSLTVNASPNGKAISDSSTKGHLWFEFDHGQSAQASTGSTTGATGDSMAALFVFNQNTVVNSDAKVVDKTGQPDVVYVSSGDFNGNVAGTIALNQVAGVANQQGNTMATALELSGAAGTDAGSNTANVETAQNLINNGVIKEAAKTGSDTAYIDTNAFQGVSGSIALNQAAGVANQQVNQVTILH